MLWPEPYDFDHEFFLGILQGNPLMYARLYVRRCNKMKGYLSGGLRLLRNGQPPRACNSYLLRNMIVGNRKHTPQDGVEVEFWKSLQRWMKLKHLKVWPGYRYRPRPRKAKAEVSVLLFSVNYDMLIE